MKDYENVIVWLDYFNKDLTRAKGRRLARESCVFEPILGDLEKAAKDAGYSVVESVDKARFPRRPYVRSGYVALEKTSAKTVHLKRISKGLVAKRTKSK